METNEVSRRAFLAAGVGGTGVLAGCPGQPGGGDSDASPALDDDSSSGDGTGGGAYGSDGGDGSDGSADGSGGGEDSADEATDAAESDGRYDGPAVMVDQVGYRPDDEKVAVVRADAASFSVLDAESDERVASGDLSEAIEDTASGDTIRHAHFDDVSDPGKYVLSVGDGDVTSVPFRVEEGVWGRTLAEVGRRFTLRRANTALDDQVSGLDLEPGHPQDREAEMYFGDEFHEEGDTIDVHGGWYDAGDYGKYVTPAAVTVGQMLLAYELYPDTFEVGQFAMPDGVSEDEREAGMPDLLAEAKFELEWIERMQRPDGAVYHKVAGDTWPGMNVRPAADTQTRYVFGLSTYGTGMAAGVMAMAARVYQNYDAGFADRMLAGATAAFEYLRDNPGSEFRFDEGQNGGSGGYRKDGDSAERLWAAAELLKTTGEDQYDQQIEDNLVTQLELDAHHVGWGDASLLGQWAYYTAEAGRDEYKSAVADGITATADEILAHVGEEGYNVSLTQSQYVWGSNAVALGRGLVLLLADEVQSVAAYREAARDQIHYVLGRSPTGRSYVTGSGERHPTEPHSRLAASTGVNVAGNVVGGANSGGGDPDLESYVKSESPPPAKCYLDVRGSWASNEPALDYAAPLIPLLAAFTPTDAVGVE